MESLVTKVGFEKSTILKNLHEIIVENALRATGDDPTREHIMILDALYRLVDTEY